VIKAMVDKLLLNALDKTALRTAIKQFNIWREDSRGRLIRPR